MFSKSTSLPRRKARAKKNQQPKILLRDNEWCHRWRMEIESGGRPALGIPSLAREGKLSQTSDRLYSCGFPDRQSRPWSATGAGGFEVLIANCKLRTKLDLGATAPPYDGNHSTCGYLGVIWTPWRDSNSQIGLIPLSLCRERRSKKVTHFPALWKCQDMAWANPGIERRLQ